MSYVLSELNITTSAFISTVKENEDKIYNNTWKKERISSVIIWYASETLLHKTLKLMYLVVKVYFMFFFYENVI